MIRFPKAPHGDLPSTGVNRRWISVAAAAGLIIGILGGELVHVVQPSARRSSPIATSIAPSAPARPAFVAVAAPADDGFLDEIDHAVQLRSAAALRVLDELTPVNESR